MRTPKILSPQAKELFVCELDTCSVCGSPLLLCNYRSGHKIVQSLSNVSQISYCPKQCSNFSCINHQVALKSAEWLQIAPINCTYSYDVIASAGWQRQMGLKTFSEIHDNLSSKIQISESHVRHLYHYRYLPLLACNERQYFDQLKQTSETCGLIYTLDGLAPEGGEPQLWVVRELHTNLTIRSGWLGGQDQTTFENFLQPIAALNFNVAAILSDKQRGLVPAVKTVFPHTPHMFCQAHYLKNISEPVADADESMKVSFRKSIRNEVGDLIRSEHTGESDGRVLTVTGMVPSPVDYPEESATKSKPVKDEIDEMVTAFIRRTRYLLTLKGRPPFRLAGVEMFEQLTELAVCLSDCISHIPDARLKTLEEGISTALKSVAKEYHELSLAAKWLRDISELLEPDEKKPRTGEQVRIELFKYLMEVKEQGKGNQVLTGFAEQICKTTVNYESGLFHCYDIEGLLRTNNDRESEFRELKRKILKTTGQKGATLRYIQRSGAWELIPCPDSLSDVVAAISQTDSEKFCKERQRVRNHRERFRLHTRSADLANKQLGKLREKWFELPSGEPYE